MPDPMEGLGEDVPPSMKPEFALVLALIRDTMLTPKPVGREQAALAILSALIPCAYHDIHHTISAESVNGEVAKTGGLLVNLSIEMADSLMLRLDNPSLGAQA
jgi:hypothetical protein